MNEVATKPSGEIHQMGHVDVLIVGAGISGIDAAYHLQKYLPGRSFKLLDALDGFGGTWRSHTYPGVRSDSDLFTFGFGWKPWSGPPIATAAEILAYLDEVLDEQDLRQHIQYETKVTKASWSSADQKWTIIAERLSSGELEAYTTDFMWMCQGYYNHEKGYTPEWSGMEDFKGEIIHPQAWREDLDYKDKNVVVIGSGATTATIVPAMAGEAKHVTVLQRSPTYFIAAPNRDDLVNQLRGLDIPPDWIHDIARKNVLHTSAVLIESCEKEPDRMKAELIAGVQEYLPEGYDTHIHFNPKYKPWQQRIAFVPDGDLFKCIASGEASVVTDHIDHFTEKGVLTESGQELEADIIVSATGLNLLVLGGIEFDLDGEVVDFSKTVAYRGLMFTGVPNLCWVFGYFRSASWTMRSDIVSELMIRIFRHMSEKGAKVVTPELRETDGDIKILPWMDPAVFNPGYLQRSLHLMPKQGDRHPWIFEHDYPLESKSFPEADLDDGLTYR
ncbi:flavin-containing monooxygenase [Henriciella marina]|uniref:NAD(P)/FAD-dependent oxidoreductase n=1 Tax=Henriciella marina TaxID=453851 RepID=A0ABT4LQ52_9PROT|nr:NAD(P)/FAD-dependent oxidoreductase [Henriciella marina]MCZ4296446.1 NAD(P)/FAD-dependent oxidoreductase [Henriciella marina]